MSNLGMVERRSILKVAAAFGGLSTLAVIAPSVSGAVQESKIPAAASPEVRLEDVLAGPNTKLTIERLGRSSSLASIVLISRTALILRVSKNWPKHITNMTTIPRCAPQFHLATGRTFQEGSTLKDLSRSQRRASPGSRALGR